MKNKLIISGTVLLLAASSALAADNGDNGGTTYYKSHELSVDGFGTASLGKYSLNNLSGARVKHDTRLGVGVGLNYFITRNLGFGADVYSENNSGAFIDSVSANMTLRLPLGQTGFAPYVFGGGGHQFELAKVWFAQVGAGMEYRFTPKVGMFLDARYHHRHCSRNYD